jgi:hypothetical protein
VAAGIGQISDAPSLDRRQEFLSFLDGIRKIGFKFFLILYFGACLQLLVDV